MKGEVGLYISNSALNALQKPNCKGHFSQWVLYFVIFGIREKSGLSVMANTYRILQLK